MSTETLTVNGLSKDEAKCLAAIDACLKEMDERRQQMKHTDAEIRQLRAANRRQLKDIRTLLHRVHTAA